MACKAPFSRKNLLIGLAILFTAMGIVANVAYAETKESVALTTVSPSQDRWIPFAAGLSPDKPKVIVTESSSSRIRLKMEIPGMWCKEVEHEGEIFTKIAIPEHGPTYEIGKPAVPVVRKMLQIPYGARVSVEVVKKEEKEFTLKDLGIDHWLDPAQPPHPLSGPKPNFVIDKDYYHTDNFYPYDLVKAIITGTIRGCRFVQLELAPIRYNPQEGKIRVLSEIELQIKLDGSDMTTTQRMLRRYACDPFERLSKSLLPNYQSYKNLAEGSSVPISDTGPPTPKPPVGYLIITPSSFYDALTPLVEWKTKKGFHVTVARTSQIGYTKEQIKQYIKNAYDTWEIPPAYVLFAADADSIPTFTSNEPIPGQPRSAVDLYYVTMNDSSVSDYIADILRGRLPAKNTTELTDMIDKILEYEKGFGDLTLDYPDSISWMNRFCLIDGLGAFPDGDVYTRNVSLECLDNSMKSDSLSASATIPDIGDMINDGRSLITFVDHCSEYAWGGNGGAPFFSQPNVRDLTNYKKYPFVLSFCCVSGRFDVDECFGETWLKQKDKAAIAYWGASCPTYFPENALIESGIYKALCNDAIYTVSGTTDRGLFNLYQVEGGDNPQVKYHFEAYNILGDPSIDLWMKACDSLSVDYRHGILVGSTTFTVVVQSNGNPVADALVCLLKENDVFQTSYTNVNGIINLNIQPTDTGTMYVTVTAHNYRPYEGTVRVLTSLLPGDVNGDCLVDIGDVVYLITYLYRGGSSPSPLNPGDVNCDGIVDIGDVVFLINYLYKGGPAPSC